MTMSAKLARLEQQEAEFMAKYSKKNQSASVPPVCATPTSPTSQSADQRAVKQKGTDEDSQRKKVKRLKKSTGSVINELNGDVMSKPQRWMSNPKRRKRKSKPVRTLRET